MSRHGVGLLDARPWVAQPGAEKLLAANGLSRPSAARGSGTDPKDKEIHLHVAAISNVA
jgi:hypothetical protein